MHHQTFADASVVELNSSPLTTAAGEHPAVCMTLWGTFQHINTSRASSLILILR